MKKAKGRGATKLLQETGNAPSDRTRERIGAMALPIMSAGTSKSVTAYRSGHCPPGLAKKNNGCMPPGQAKKWRIGQALPRDVIYYELPPAVVVRIGTPPAGHRYVRVAADILLIAIGTGMVVDAIADLSSM